ERRRNKCHYYYYYYYYYPRIHGIYCVTIAISCEWRSQNYVSVLCCNLHTVMCVVTMPMSMSICKCVCACVCVCVSGSKSGVVVNIATGSHFTTGVIK